MNVVLDSRVPGSRSDLNSTESSPSDVFNTLSPEERHSIDRAVSAPSVNVDNVEGLPLSLVALYAEVALRHAVIHVLESGRLFASVFGLEGAWGDGDTPTEALDELRDAIIGWVAVKRRVGAKDIPRFEGIDLNIDL